MKLFFSPTSPFVRKVRVCAIEMGVADRLALVPANAFAEDGLRTVNPLSKVPALSLKDGTVLYDSPVLCEYVDHLGGGGLFPAPGPDRWTALRRQALGDGICDAALRQVLENRRAEGDRHADDIARQALAVASGLDSLEQEAVSLASEALTIGEISVACALGYLDLRFSHQDWRIGRPNLTAWFAEVAKRPSMVATQP
jgi:glutathione S-transferase